MVNFFLLLTTFFFAVNVNAELPDAGQTSVIINEKTPIKNKPSESEIKLQPPETKKESSQSDTKITISNIEITGATFIPTSELYNLIKIDESKDFTFSELESLANLITQYYRKQGFLLAYAYIPAQEIINKKIEIKVLEGKLGEIKISGKENLRFSQINQAPGEIVKLEKIERDLLILSDTPGIEVKSALVPGSSVGTSDLNVDIQPSSKYTGQLNLDNFGSKYTGYNRIGGSFNVNNPARLGDVISFNGLTTGGDLNFARMAYQLSVNNLGSKVGVAYSDLNYQIGKEFSSLNAYGSAKIASLFLIHPLVRSRFQNLYAQLNFDSKRTQDKTDSTSTTTDKSINLLNIGLSGDRKDLIGGGGFNTFSGTVSYGYLDIESLDTLSTDQTTAKTNGNFAKLLLRASRLQRISDKTSLYFSYIGQLSESNLNSSEKFAVGGPYSVRAYPQGEIMADHINALTIEARYSLKQDTQLSFFIDSAHTKINHSTWTSTDNTRTLSGYGLEALWLNEAGYSAKIIYAKKIGNEVATSDKDKDGRLWLQFLKTF